MCGRFVQSSPLDHLQALFQASCQLAGGGPRYNLAPTQAVLAVRRNPATGQRSLDALRWGLIPHWAKDASVGAKLFNARADGLIDKPSFREAFAKRRCLIPADAFYEWALGGKPRQPFAIRRPDGQPFAFAGLWENWKGPDGGWVRTVTIITTEANGLLAGLHHRMPVIIDPADYAKWLGDEPASPQELLALLRPCPEDWLEIFAIGPAVNRAAADGPELLMPKTLGEAEDED